MVYCIFCIAGGSWCHAKRGGVGDRDADADEVKAATALLPFTRPGKKLNVQLEDSTPTQALHQLAATIKQTAFGGQLVMWL